MAADSGLSAVLHFFFLTAICKYAKMYLLRFRLVKICCFSIFSLFSFFAPADNDVIATLMPTSLHTLRVSLQNK